MMIMKKYKIEYIIAGFPTDRVVTSKSLVQAVLDFELAFPEARIIGAFEI